MKRCYQCDQTYSDQSMRFCLVDGTPLTTSYDSEETLLIQDGDIINEARIKFSPELFRLYCLFGYETDNRQLFSLWTELPLVSPVPSNSGTNMQERFNTWLQSKRQFSSDELASGTWQLIKEDDKKIGRPFSFRTDGRFTNPPIAGNNEGFLGVDIRSVANALG